MTQVPGLKDERLAELARGRNVARFASFGPGASPEVRHVVVASRQDTSTRSIDFESAIDVVLRRSRSQSVNIRSFLPDREKGCPFYYGLTHLADAVRIVRELASQGYFTIVNETIDVGDGGVSGVLLGGIAEFAPDDTPRAVEKSGSLSLPVNLANKLLAAVYGFDPELDSISGRRMEFSIHPRRVGHLREHVLWWETESVAPTELTTAVRWPNRFSQHLGDKAFGLIVGNLLGLPVPLSTVISRRVAPFSFGESTGTAEWWLRTCPNEQTPGKFTTLPEWGDPYELLSKEDPTGENIASVIAQEAVDAAWSGATLPGDTADPDYVEGVAGGGDLFMLGKQSPISLPQHIVRDVQALTSAARQALGPVRTEWAHDGTRAWLLQLHVAAYVFNERYVFSPGDATQWLNYRVEDGLESLRALIHEAKRFDQGILVHGRVGLTSHVGDLLRQAAVPGRLALT